MKRILISVVLFGILKIGYTQESIVFGTVTNGDSPLVGVSVSQFGQKGGTQTNDKGEFRILAKKKDVIQFVYEGMSTLSTTVNNPEDELLVILEPEVAYLPEVTVKENKKKTQKVLAREYTDDYNIIRTKFGYLDKDRAAYPIRMVKGEDLPYGNQHFLQALRMVFPLVRITEGIEPRAYLRSSSPVIYDLDGQILLETPIGLTITEIDRIAVIPSMSAAVKYGTFGAGGIIVINTKSGKPQKSRKSTN